MEEKNNELTIEEQDMVMLIDKITIMINERKLTEDIGEAGETLLNDLAQTKEVVLNIAENRSLIFQKLKDPSLSDEDKSKLMESLEMARQFEESRKNSHSVLQNMYDKFIHEDDSSQM